ncbi:Putative uncharacterized protein [Taphrina deformans PYCC 5710]|uniref:Lysophospholipase n=1 Tax=Taphrina deformans (strain PYCC 5710 / ATCC 11124 / CBS 356.35 / IMI 108563 / JCM 9778 / NBRC 8474) TaxID=1097556 RepID=R4XHY6_TAPDE|nr:Putative uncharacterized protein [Taphrina deformans PYCC 5710]|eukprot:CCG83017.1 Putative uncharacterized protein [Taphrina deformans PYCC 5710]
MKESFNFAEGSMGANIIEEAKAGPHMHETAHVRSGSGLCEQELQFVQQRTRFTKKSLARYLGMKESEICEEDVPLIGIAASGGGLRACLNTTSVYEIMQDEGILDLSTYLAGVSGSTWAQALLYSKAFGNRRPAKTLEHLKDRITSHIADPTSILHVLENNEARKYIMRGVLERFHAGYKDLGITELYAFMLTTRLFVPESKSRLYRDDLLISRQSEYLIDGHAPMPLYSVVRQELPDRQQVEAEIENDETRRPGKVLEDSSYFQFFEFTPFEFGSEEIDSWIPTWSVGRSFKNGQSIDTKPEVSLSTLLGTFSSAFCASLSAYIQEVEPLLPKDNSMFSALKKQIASREEELKAIHFIDATKIPNYAFEHKLNSDVPSHMSQLEHLELCDAGMANNMPFYPLLRRNCDIIIALDSSADINTTPWFSRTEGYAKQRNIKSWPVGMGWPKQDGETAKELATASAKTPGEASDKLEKATAERYGLDGVNVWVGQSTEHKPSSRSSDSGYETADSLLKAQIVNDDWEVVSKSTGLMVIYLPLIGHPDVPEVDPVDSSHLSTWNFTYTPDQVEGVRRLARANFDAARIKNAIRAMYNRKKETRLSQGNTSSASPSSSAAAAA